MGLAHGAENLVRDRQARAVAGVAQNEYAGHVQAVVTGDDLFAQA